MEVLDLVTFELAVKLKGIKFDYHTHKYYERCQFEGGGFLPTNYGVRSCCNSSLSHLQFAAPSLEEVKTWFRKEHNLIVESCMSQDGKWYFDLFYHPDAKKDYKQEPEKATFDWWDSFEEALEKGLFKASKMVKL